MSFCRYSGALRSSGAGAPSQYITAGEELSWFWGYKTFDFSSTFEDLFVLNKWSWVVILNKTACLHLALRDLYESMDKNASSIPPIILLQFLHMAFPQFAEKGDQGQYLQQVWRLDFWSHVFTGIHSIRIFSVQMENNKMCFFIYPPRMPVSAGFRSCGSSSRN